MSLSEPLHRVSEEMLMLTRWQDRTVKSKLRSTPIHIRHKRGENTRSLLSIFRSLPGVLVLKSLYEELEHEVDWFCGQPRLANFNLRNFSQHITCFKDVRKSHLANEHHETISNYILSPSQLLILRRIYVVLAA